ncbi:MAG TPA: hypothetical protein VH439_14900 [Gemmatimonadales bacterium]|jgi:hypothetical protein
MIAVRQSERGIGLPEVMIGILIMAIIGAALTRLLIVQSRFFDHQMSLRSARMVSRGALNVMLSDLRLVDASGAPGDTLGLVAAAPTSLTLRVPYGMGIVCNVGANVTVSLVPLDTLMLTTAAFSGYAWRDTLGGRYHYQEAGAGIANSTPGSCAAGFTAIPGGRVVALTPVPAAGLVGTVSPGVPVLIYQRIRYDLMNSTSYPGKIGLWRTLLTSGLTEEIAAPFDTSAVFKFFVLNRDTSQAAVPAQLGDVRGIDIFFNAVSERTAEGRSVPQQARATTAVFFQNRLN